MLIMAIAIFIPIMCLTHSTHRVSRSYLHVMMSSSQYPPHAAVHHPDSRAYTRQADHTPNTTEPEEAVYILALRTDAAHHERMTALRNRYFPAKINKLEAHIALFRALPGTKLDTLHSDIRELVEATKPFPIKATRPFPMGHGVGINAYAPEANAIFERLKECWADFLSKQDQSFRAHYTVQNKVEKEEVESTLKEIKESFQVDEGMVEGLVLYRYDKGFWRHSQEYVFGKTEQ